MPDQDYTPICLTILVVGTVQDSIQHTEMSDFMKEMRLLLEKTFPSFVPGQPPITISWSELPIQKEDTIVGIATMDD